MAKVLTAEARITATDGTGRVFEQIANKVRGLQGAFKSLSGATASVGHGITHNVGRLQKAVHTLAPVAAGAAAYKTMHGVSSIVHETVKATAEGAHERVRMEASGMLKGEIEESEKLAGELSAKYKPISQTQILHSLRNMRAIVGTFHEAAEIIDPLLKMRVVAMGAHPEHAHELEEDFDNLVKGMEIKGVTQNKPHFIHYMENMSKALNVFGDTLRPTDYYEMFKYGRAATTALSDKFQLMTGPTLAQELKGSSAGKAISSFYTQFVAGKMSNPALAQLQALGLIDPRQVIKTKTGNVKGVKPGGISGKGDDGNDYLKPGQTDPYGWVQHVLLPAMKKHNITDPAKILQIIGAMSSQTTTAQMLGIFATQQGRIEKDWNLIKGAKGLDAANTFMTKDPFIAWQGVTEQFNNLLQAAGSPLAPAAAAGMNAIAEAIANLTKMARENPVGGAAGLLGGAAAVTAAGGLAGWLALKGAGKALGFGARAVAGAATTAAELSPQEAAKAAADAIFKKAPLVVAGGSALGVIGGVGLGGLGLSYAAGNMVFGHPRSFSSAAAGGMLGAMDGDMAMAAAIANQAADQAAARAAGLAASHAALMRWGAEFPQAPQGTGTALDTARSFMPPARHDAAADRGAGALDPSRSFMSPESLRSALADLHPVVQEPVKAELTGQADIGVRVTIEPSAMFLTTVDQKIANGIANVRVNGAPPKGTGGSTGKVMPEAGAEP